MLATDLGMRPMKGLFTFRNDLLRPTDKIVGEVCFIGLQHIESGTGRRIGEDLILAEQLTGRKFRFSPGDIVYGYLRPYLNKVWIADCEGLCSVDQYVLQPDNSQVDTRYLAHAMRSPLFLKQSEQLTGVLTLPRLRSGLLESIEIPVPPLDEQRRIVARIEDFTHRVAEVHRLRQESIEWIESALPAARNQEFEGIADKFENLPLAELADTQLGKMLSPKSKTGVSSFPYLRNANVQWDRIDLSDLSYMDFDERERLKFALKPGDLLICEGGEAGRAAMWKGELEDCFYQKALHRVRTKADRLDPRYLLHHLFWASGSGGFSDLTTGSTFAHLTMEKLKTYRVITPPLDEQRRIAAYLDSLETKANAIRAAQLETQRELDALMPAVLDRAFRGEL